MFVAMKFIKLHVYCKEKPNQVNDKIWILLQGDRGLGIPSKDGIRGIPVSLLYLLNKHLKLTFDNFFIPWFKFSIYDTNYTIINLKSREQHMLVTFCQTRQCIKERNTMSIYNLYISLGR